MADPSAPSLRDRIAELAIIWDRESIEPAEDFANAVMGLLADADPTDLGLEASGVWYCRRHAGTANEDDHHTLCPWWDHADHCDAEHDEGLDDGACSPCQWVELLIPPARPRTKEAHTVDIGHVHVLTAPGGPCAPTCPHPHHRTEETPDA